MSEALLTRDAPAPAQLQRFRSGKTCDRRRLAPVIEAPALPNIEPGQLWLVELPPTTDVWSPLEYRALTAANIIMYDRTLAKMVGDFLPLGGYAEPAAASGAAFDAAAERAWRFACDGWSVARFVDPRALSGRQRIEKPFHKSWRARTS